MFAGTWGLIGWCTQSTLRTLTGSLSDMCRNVETAANRRLGCQRLALDTMKKNKPPSN